MTHITNLEHWTHALPSSIRNACLPLFDTLPLNTAMSELIGAHPDQRDTALAVAADPAVAEYPSIVAGLWLYVSDLATAHDVCQEDPSGEGSLWHAILHRREGDFSNAHYWIHMAGRTPRDAGLPDADAFIDAVKAAKGNDPDLVAAQRHEWQQLFVWCANKCVAP